MKTTSMSLLALVAASPALAQSDPTAPTTNPAGDEIVVTATRSSDPIPIGLLGASVTVLDDAALQARQTRIVSDVLRDVPGVAVSRVGAVGGLTAVRIRGAEGNHTLVLIDGIEASDPYDGEYDFGTLIADENARIEVLRGQQSSLYGSDAIGGVINYITLTGAEAPGVRLRAEGGSRNTLAGGARIAGLADGVDYALSSSVYHTGGYPSAVGGRRDVGSDSVGASAKLTWAPSPTLKLTGVFRYSYTDAQATDTDNGFGSPTYGLPIDSPGVHFRNTGYYALARAQLDLFDGRLTNVVTAQLADTTRDNYDVADAFSPPAGQPIVKAYGDHGRRLKGSYAGTFRFGGGAVRQSLTAAVDVERESERATVPRSGAFLGWRHLVNTGVVGEYELTADDRLGIGASVRHDLNTRFADDTTFRAQASYRFASGTRLHAAAGSGVKAPTFGELFDYFAGRYVGSPGLEPEKSTGFEAGVAQSFGGGRLTLDATYFDNRLKHEITTVYDENFVGHPLNLPGRTRQRGVEVAATARLGGGWRFDASYTHLRAPQDRAVTFPGTLATGTFTGQAVRRAKDIASANLTWAPADRRVSATVTARYNGPQRDVFYGYFPPLLVRLHGFTLINLDASYRLTDTLEAFGRVENLLNRNYFEVYGYATAGRAAYGGVRARF